MSSTLDRTITEIPRDVWEAFCNNACKVKGDDPEKMKLEQIDMAGHYFLAKLIQQNRHCLWTKLAQCDRSLSAHLGFRIVEFHSMSPRKYFKGTFKIINGIFLNSLSN